MANETSQRTPFFYDITLRDGNQALKNPWNIEEKERVFNALSALGVQGAELGFSAASNMDFESVSHLASIANDDMVVSTLARANEYDINKAYESIKHAKKPRIHTFIGMSPHAMKYVLKRNPKDVQRIAIEMVEYARELLGEKGEIQFSAEHFGDCRENLDFVIETLEKVIEAGAEIINLPNTVERYRTNVFVKMVEKVYQKIGDKCTIAVHNHNDLGQATATTVESFFTGATQLETSLNGLGERAGNTNIYEVAVSLYNCGVNVDLNFEKIYETALLIEEMTEIKIPEKAPLIGYDSLAHRSGIHQAGSIKTKKMKKGAYRPIDPEFIGRTTGELLEFTSQSGKNAIYEILKESKWPVTIEEASELQPMLKKISSERGALKPNDIIEEYKKRFINIDGPYSIIDFKETKTTRNYHSYIVKIKYNNKSFEETCEGDGPIDAMVNLFKKFNHKVKLVDYEQIALDAQEKGSSAHALTSIILYDKNLDKEINGRGLAFDTREANINAVVSGFNLIERKNNNH